MSVAPHAAPQGPQLFVSGRNLVVRQVRAGDVGPLAALITRLSARTRHQRYLAARSFTPEAARAEAERIAAARTRRHVALVAAGPLFGHEDAVGVAELALLADEPGVAELGIVVRDDMQGAGVGSLLMRAVAAVAPQLGVRALHVELLADNAPMRRLAAGAGAARVVGQSDGVLQLRVRLDGQAARRGPAAGRMAA